MSEVPRNYYASMVLNASYPQPQPAFAMGAPPKKDGHPYRTPYCSAPQAMPVMGLAPDAVASSPSAAPVSLSPLVAQQPPARQSPYLGARQQPGYETLECAKPLSAAARMYTHNPYASPCTIPHQPMLTAMPGAMMMMPPGAMMVMDPYAPTTYQSPYTPSATRSSAGATPQSTSGTTFPVYTPSDVGSGESVALANTLEEQFLAMVGTIAAAAKSSRGRHLLLSVLRLQHMDKIQMIYDEIAPQVNAVAVDQHGCHVVRTLIEYIPTPLVEQLVPFFEPSVLLEMATATQHTRRVLQAIFEHHRSPALMPIVEVVKDNCKHLSMTQQGCIVIIRIVEYAEATQKRALISELVPILPALATDQFGNYVVQCILKNMTGYVSIDDLVGSFQGHWVQLSCDKYSSNVMERIIGMLKGPPRQRIVRELILDASNLQCLMQNSFGNYVLQAVIGSAVDQAEFRIISDTVTPFLHTSPYGHRIEAKLKSRCEALYKASTATASPADAATK